MALMHVIGDVIKSYPVSMYPRNFVRYIIWGQREQLDLPETRHLDGYLP